MRDLKELYQLIIDSPLLEKHWYICNVIKLLARDLIITKEEGKMLMEHFNLNKPSDTQHTEFTLHPQWIARKDQLSYDAWWWCASLKPEQFKEVMAEKRRFLSYLIKKLEE